MEKARIGIFDSGFGGLTVMRAVCDLLPSEDIIYFGDTARLPYGNKSKATIVRYSVENANFLVSQNIDVLVIACHTASCLAKEQLQKILPIPVIDVISPSVKLAISQTKTKKIAVLGTYGTISSGVYQNELRKLCPEIEIFPVACPLFVPLVEEGFTHHKATEIIAKEYLTGLAHKGIDVTILACTHYPLLVEVIQKILGEEMILIDPAIPTAEKTRLVLEKGPSSSSLSPTYQFFVSDNPQKFGQIGSKFLKKTIASVSLQNVDPQDNDLKQPAFAL
jgi:glutamate racemase